jgi:hypothetical protein
MLRFMTVPETPLLEALRCDSQEWKSKADRKEMRAGAGFAGASLNKTACRKYANSEI